MQALPNDDQISDYCIHFHNIKLQLLKLKRIKSIELNVKYIYIFNNK